MGEITLGNGNLSLTFDDVSGGLCAVEAPRTRWPIVNGDRQGLSFHMLLPLPGRRNNPVLGERQRPAAIEVDQDGRRMTVSWHGVESVHGGRHDVSVRERVHLDERRAVFELTIENRSDHVIESVHFPSLADVRPPQDEEQFSLFLPAVGSAQEWPLRPRFENRRGYWGVDRPTQYGGANSCGPPMAPFVLLRSPAQGLYVGVDTAGPDLLAWHTELDPGYRDAIDSRVPGDHDLGGIVPSTRFEAVHLPFIQPGESRTLTPIVLEAYVGDWQRGADLYRAWRDTWMTGPPRPRWVDDPHAWLQIQMNSPEDELRFGFSDLVEVGRECAEHGVAAIQLVGWNDGGQDQNNPCHDPDPRLGTPEELRAAIDQVRRLGVRTVLFCKFTWADRATDRFRRELIAQAVKDPHGDYYVHPGYRYHTPTQLLDVNTKRLIPMCFLSEDYLRVCEDEFAKVLALRPDGILFDECLHHGPALLCFDPDHGHRPGAPVYANDRLLIRRFSRMAQDAGVECLFVGEACYDWQLDAYQMTYMRSWSTRHVPLSRYLAPAVPMMTAITGFDDRNMVNQSLLYRYALSYEPYNFKGRLGDFPLTLAYGKRMDAVRRELRAHLWDGEFRHEVGASVTCQDGPHRPYAVFVAADGTSSVAIANYDEERTAMVQVELDSGRPLTRWRLIEDDVWRPLHSGISVPPRSAAVVMEG